MSGMAPSRINCFGMMSDEALAWAGVGRAASEQAGWCSQEHRNHRNHQAMLTRSCHDMDNGDWIAGGVVRLPLLRSRRGRLLLLYLALGHVQGTLKVWSR